jgi:hypothetical protein
MRHRGQLGRFLEGSGSASRRPRLPCLRPTLRSRAFETNRFPSVVQSSLSFPCLRIWDQIGHPTFKFCP